MYSGDKKLNNSVPVRFMGNSKPLKKGVKLKFKECEMRMRYKLTFSSLEPLSLLWIAPDIWNKQI